MLNEDVIEDVRSLIQALFEGRVYVVRKERYNDSQKLEYRNYIKIDSK